MWPYKNSSELARKAKCEIGFFFHVLKIEKKLLFILKQMEVEFWIMQAIC